MTKGKEEQDLRDRFLAEADRAGAPPPLQPRKGRAIRLWQSAYIFLAVVLVVGSAAAVTELLDRTGGRDRGQVPVAALVDGYRILVLGYNASGEKPNSSVWSARITDGQISEVRRFDTSTDADVTLSPDGSRLYAVGHTKLSTKNPSDAITVYDTSTGSVLQEADISSRWQGSTGFHLTDKIVASPDGRQVYFLVGFPADSIAPPQALATFDTASSTVLPDQVPLDRCGGSPILLPLRSSELAVVCTQMRDVEFISVGPAGRPISRSTLGLPLADVAAAGLSLDHTTLYVVSKVGHMVVIDVTTRKVVAEADLSLPADTVVGISRLAITPTGERLLLGLDDAQDMSAGVADSVMSVRTSDWADLIVEKSGEFSWFALTSDGNVVFTIDPQTSAVRAMDARQHRVLGILGQLGVRPLTIHAVPEA